MIKKRLQVNTERSKEGGTVLASSPVRLVKVGVSYKPKGKPEVRALSEISLEVKPREFLSIVGPSGCGKSTMLRVMANLQPASEGEVAIMGRQLSRKATPGTFMMFQHSVLLDWLSVERNISLPLEVSGVDRHGALAEAKNMLQFLGLSECGHMRPYELSGGMQQRVAIGRALITKPKLLLMDEPFGALDALTREQMQDFLQNVWNTNPLAVVFVTHSISEAVMLSDRVIVMSSRPGSVIGEFDVGIPRPRGPEVRKSEEFYNCSDLISDLIRSNVE